MTATTFDPTVEHWRVTTRGLDDASWNAYNVESDAASDFFGTLLEQADEAEGCQLLYVRGCTDPVDGAECVVATISQPLQMVEVELRVCNCGGEECHAIAPNADAQPEEQAS